MKRRKLSGSTACRQFSFIVGKAGLVKQEETRNDLIKSGYKRSVKP